MTFNGHKAAITSLKYDQLGGRLASGSKVRPSVGRPDVFCLVKECKVCLSRMFTKLLGDVSVNIYLISKWKRTASV